MAGLFKSTVDSPVEGLVITSIGNGSTVTWITDEILLNPDDVTVLLYQVVCARMPGV